MKRLGRWSRNLALVSISLLLTEGVLQVLSTHVGAVDRLLAPGSVTQEIADSVVGLRGNPRWHDHDGSGFRNPTVLDKADIVTLGDSHTYGAGIARADSWPVLLGLRSGRPVYNMAFFGWGPGEAYVLLDKALSLRPRTIVYALYFGNDLLDVFRFASSHPELSKFLPRSLADTSAILEAKNPIGPRVAFLFALGDTASQHQEGLLWSFQRYLSQHSKLYGVARAMWHLGRGNGTQTPVLLSRDMDRALEGMTERQRSFIAVHRDPQWKTLLTPSYRNLVMYVQDPRIRAGLEGAKSFLDAMESRCRQEGVRFLVVLLPTKESVFASRVRMGAEHASLDSLVGNEKLVRDEIVDWLKLSSIEYVDVLPALQGSTAQPYFVDADGHPNEVGHRVIAESVINRFLAPK